MGCHDKKKRDQIFCRDELSDECVRRIWSTETRGAILYVKTGRNGRAKNSSCKFVTRIRRTECAPKISPGHPPPVSETPSLTPALRRPEPAAPLLTRGSSTSAPPRAAAPGGSKCRELTCGRVASEDIGSLPVSHGTSRAPPRRVGRNAAPCRVGAW